MTDIVIDEDRFNFLKRAYFGRGYDLDMASQRAYRDMSRTLYLRKMSEEHRQKGRSTVTRLFEKELGRLSQKDLVDQPIFDRWHYQLCTQIKWIYHELSPDTVFTYGQAQAWLNETLKYLYVIGNETVPPLIPYLHVNLDQHLMEVADAQFGLAQLKQPWSRLDDYTVYLAYQQALRHALQPQNPFRWVLHYL